jgi:hypothetical protein
MRPFDLLQLAIEPIASPWTPPTRHVAAWPGVVYQLARNQAKTPETHVEAAGLKGSGGPAWLRTWHSRTCCRFKVFFTTSHGGCGAAVGPAEYDRRTAGAARHGSTQVPAVHLRHSFLFFFFFLFLLFWLPTLERLSSYGRCWIGSFVEGDSALKLSI